jgi:hypothetical protein
MIKHRNCIAPSLALKITMVFGIIACSTWRRSMDHLMTLMTTKAMIKLDQDGASGFRLRRRARL